MVCELGVSPIVPTKGYAIPGFTFPTVGRLGLTSPPSRSYPIRTSVLCSAKTPKRTSQVCSLFAVRPQYPSPFRSGEASGPPKFPSYPHEYMQWSLIPAVTCALAISHPGLLPSEHWKSSAFLTIVPQVILFGPQLYIFRDSIQSLYSCIPRLQTPFTEIACGFSY